MSGLRWSRAAAIAQNGQTPCARPCAMLIAAPTVAQGQRRRRRGGRVVECTALEMRHTGNRIGGSNPSLSAIFEKIREFSATNYCRHLTLPTQEDYNVAGLTAPDRRLFLCFASVEKSQREVVDDDPAGLRVSQTENSS